jgi:hypothetical protein
MAPADALPPKRSVSEGLMSGGVPPSGGRDSAMPMLWPQGMMRPHFQPTLDPYAAASRFGAPQVAPSMGPYQPFGGFSPAPFQPYVLPSQTASPLATFEQVCSFMGLVSRMMSANSSINPASSAPGPCPPIA